MAGRPGKFQPRFTAGAIDDLMAQNSDVDTFGKAAAAMVNFRPIPQGGFTLADGLLKVSRCRALLTPVSFTGASFPLSTAAVATTPVTLATLTLPAGAQVTAVDVAQFAANLPGGAAPTYVQPNPPESPLIQGQLWVQYWNGTAWVNLAPPLGLVDTLRNRRFSLPPGQTVATIAIRLQATTGVSSGAVVGVGAVAVWQETTTYGVFKYRQFNVSSALVYDLIFTQGTVDVFKGDVWLAAIPLAATAAQVTGTKSVQELSSMILTHQLAPPALIQRQGYDNEWQIQPPPWSALPNYDFGDTVYTNYTPSVWTLTFVNFDASLGATEPPLPDGGCHYTISVNGVASTAIQQPSAGTYDASNWDGTAAAIQAAILSIPGVSPGVTVTQTQTQISFTEFQVTFGGAANQGNGWAVSGQVLDKSDAAITAGQFTIGVAGGEPIMSNTRGWPAACGLYQERLVLAGFAGVPLGALFSETGNPYVVDTRLTGSTAPFFVVLDGQGDETILDAHLGRTLDFFTTFGEWWVQPGAIAATTAPTIVYSTSNGIAPTVEPIETDGVTVFCHASGGVLFEYYYEYQFQNYTAKPISSQAASLVSGVIDNALQRATSSTGVNLHYLVLANGQATIRSTMRQEEINGFASRVTDGQFLAVGVNANAEACFVVQRLVNGSPVAFFEKAQAGLWLDAAETVAVTSGQATITGLTDYVGATVWAIVDGYAQGPFAVTARASLTLEFPALANGNAIVGRWTAPSMTTLPLPREVGPKTVVRRPGRAHTVRVSVANSTHLAIAANGGQPYEAPLRRFGQPADQPMSAAPYTGWVKLEGFPGYRDDVQVTITQTRPGALTVTGVTIEADL